MHGVQIVLDVVAEQEARASFGDQQVVASVGSERNAIFTRKRFSRDAIARLSECCERSSVSCRRISIRSSVSRSDWLKTKLARGQPNETAASNMMARRLRHWGPD